MCLLQKWKVNVLRQCYEKSLKLRQIVYNHLFHTLLSLPMKYFFNIIWYIIVTEYLIKAVEDIQYGIQVFLSRYSENQKVSASEFLRNVYRLMKSLLVFLETLRRKYDMFLSDVHHMNISGLHPDSLSRG